MALKSNMGLTFLFYIFIYLLPIQKLRGIEISKYICLRTLVVLLDKQAGLCIISKKKDDQNGVEGITAVT